MRIGWQAGNDKLSEFEHTLLWSRHLNSEDNSPDKKAKEDLQAAYRQFWNNAVTLSREIQKDLPGLTLHDEAHFEALWKRADQIAGPDYQLTPLEVFVLGGAILIHDAANAVATYAGGLLEVQRTPEWQDAETEWMGKNKLDPATPLPPNAHNQVLLETLRRLHAQRAETLAKLQVNVGANSFHLLPNDQLRVHLGDLIGKIAASHHWNLSLLPKLLPASKGALNGMPTSWTIRPIVLACLLRCADATQLDQQRAPDFLYGLLQLRGVSELHWRAQNRLAAPHQDPFDNRALLFTSTTAFEEADADAWWIACDAIQVANRELQACDSLLRDLKLPSFAIARIRDAESPDRLASHVTVKGWRPVAAEVKISRVDTIVEMFGGEKLYGHEMSVPLRELIQNAADAVQLRRDIEPAGSDYEGRIIIRMRPVGDDTNDTWLIVDDDGIGMSENVLTGPLIDFGSSYMSTSLVRSERPGLLAKSKRRIGKFGIGFFSCFMLGNQVSVTSRPFDRGLDHGRTLQFRSDAITRPMLIESRPPDFSASLSTRVAVRVSEDRLAEMLTFQHRHFFSDKPASNRSNSMTLAQLVGRTCPMLAVDVYVEEGSGSSKIHSRRWMDEDRLSWLNRILLPELRNSAAVNQLVIEMDRLAFIDASDPSAGLACITSMGGCGVDTIGGLKAFWGSSQYRDDFIGTIDHEPAGPQREHGPIRARDKVAAWATDQAVKVSRTDLPPSTARHIIAARVARYGGDATPIAITTLNQEWATIAEIFHVLSKGEPIYAPIKIDRDGPVIVQVRERQTGFLDNYGPDELELLETTLEASDNSSEHYYKVPTDDNAASTSLLALLDRLAEQHGYHVNMEFIQRFEFAKYIGENSPRENLHFGKLIGCNALKLTAKRF